MRTGEREGLPELKADTDCHLIGWLVDCFERVVFQRMLLLYHATCWPRHANNQGEHTYKHMYLLFCVCNRPPQATAVLGHACLLLSLAQKVAEGIILHFCYPVARQSAEA